MFYVIGNMTISYAVLAKKPYVFQQITGISIRDFEKMAQKLMPFWTKFLNSKKLEGRPAKLKGLRNHLLAMLMYYRTYITYEFLGHLFNVDETTVMRSIKRIELFVCKTVGIKKDRTMSKGNFESIIIDVTEQAINRPKSNQRKYYSGKKNGIQSKLRSESMIKVK